MFVQYYPQQCYCKCGLKYQLQTLLEADDTDRC